MNSIKHMSPIMNVRMRGPSACFSRPENRPDRVSYEAPTHAVARGILECHYWKPECCYVIHSVEILNPLVWESRFCNEVKDFSSLNQIDVDNLRTQRMTTLLHRVDFVVNFSIALSTKGERDGEPLIKHQNIITHRLKTGGYHEHPSFGLREFPAFLDLLDRRSDAPPALDFNRNIGPMYFDRVRYFDTFHTKAEVSLFFHAKIKSGVVLFPTYDSIIENGLRIGKEAA
jgi:CRISPR-associated protein Cas5d